MSYAYSINNLGQVVGDNGPAFIWQNDLGYRTLQSLLPADSLWNPRVATWINDSGVIVGWGYYNNGFYAHGFKMTP
jgi:hypothetical protein